MNNTKHTIEDFLLDESFKDWALDRDKVNKSAWRQWIKVHPEAWDMVEDACYLLQNLEIHETEVKQEEIDADFEEIAEYYDQKFTKKETKIFNLSLPINKAVKIAATVLIFILAGIGLYQTNNRQAEYLTRNNEVREIQLPDGSNVILNENSKLAFNKNWQEEKLRKVTLEGEAYFNVSKKAVEGQKIKFVVRSGDVKVEVLGTKFNINTNEQHTMVVLNSGKIRLTAPNESLSMNPGDVVEYQTGAKSLIRKKDNSNRYTSWTKNINQRESSNTKVSTNQESEENLSNTKAYSKNTSSEKSEYMNSESKANIQAGNTNRSDDKGNTNPDYNIQGNQSNTQPVAGGGNQIQNSAHYILHNIDQNASKTSNQSEIFQHGNNNNAYIEQIGDGLKSKQVQKGNNNTASTQFEDINIKDEADEFEWSTHQYQEGAGNISVFKLIESYNSNVYSRQKGNENISEATVNGEENILIMLQEGHFNEIRATQDGQNNEAGVNPNDPGIYQQGNFNEAEIMQHGNNNTIKVNQQGNNNKTNINQNDNKNF